MRQRRIDERRRRATQTAERQETEGGKRAIERQNPNPQMKRKRPGGSGPHSKRPIETQRDPRAGAIETQETHRDPKRPKSIGPHWPRPIETQRDPRASHRAPKRPKSIETQRDPRAGAIEMQKNYRDSMTLEGRVHKNSRS